MDVTRLLADVDGLEDANFEEKTAKANVLRIHTLLVRRWLRTRTSDMDQGVEGQDGDKDGGMKRRCICGGTGARSLYMTEKRGRKHNQYIYTYKQQGG